MHKYSPSRALALPLRGVRDLDVLNRICAQLRGFVSDLLTVSGFRPDGDDARLWELLHSLYVAVALYELCTPRERAVVADTQRKLKYFFVSECKLRERKRKKRETESTSPTPPTKEKDKEKEIEKRTKKKYENIFSDDLEKRRMAFRELCLSYRSKYDDSVLADFYNYWSEESHHAGKMRFEAQRFWNLEKRLARWAKNHVASDNAAASLRLEKTKKRQKEETAGAAQQQLAAEMRAAADARREAEQAEAKAGSVSLEEYLATHPGSTLKMLKK